MRVYNRYKKYKLSTNHNWVPPKVSLIGQIVIYLLPAMVVFIFFPAMLFTYFEGWDYTISAYYCFVTLTTIGKAFLLSHAKRLSKASISKRFFFLFSLFKALAIMFQPFSLTKKESLACILSSISYSSCFGLSQVIVNRLVVQPCCLSNFDFKVRKA